MAADDEIREDEGIPGTTEDAADRRQVVPEGDLVRPETTRLSPAQKARVVEDLPSPEEQESLYLALKMNQGLSSVEFLRSLGLDGKNRR